MSAVGLAALLRRCAGAHVLAVPRAVRNARRGSRSTGPASIRRSRCADRPVPATPAAATNPFTDPAATVPCLTPSGNGTPSRRRVLFLFGLVNAGVILRGVDTGSWAVLMAALIGRPIGVLAAVDSRWRSASGCRRTPLAGADRDRAGHVERLHLCAVRRTSLLPPGAVLTDQAWCVVDGRRRPGGFGRPGCFASAGSRAPSRTEGHHGVPTAAGDGRQEVRRIADGQLEQAIAGLRRRGDSESDAAVHAARRHIKKVRALFRLVRPALGRYGAVDRRLRTVKRLLAPIADGEAVVDTLARLRQSTPEAAGPTSSVASAPGSSPRTVARRRRLPTTVCSRRAPDSSAPSARRSGVALSQTASARSRPGSSGPCARRAARRWHAHPTIARYHKWRQRVKDQWLQVRLLEGRCGEADGLAPAPSKSSTAAWANITTAPSSGTC